ncbi:class I SAM-dependent methyltransferase [Streptomyces sp. NBC_01190]|uniref:class I SAM-dependent methyltransferase n=1 Tax=Streptomyces sp. NBC_01190 TaxID=2903767 RepID=UPI00386874D8|nr:class I SAM-dependent methyltransferase [Streptomyces sp. NBC_01190]
MLPVAVPTARAWSTADPYATALRTGRGPLFLGRSDGWLLPLDVERWCAEPDAADRSVLDACHGPTLDIGCGPGRLVTALAARGLPALGIDVSPEAVRRTRAAGGTALLRSVFDPVPREGRWQTALLIDGNIGIGGDPVALLTRVRGLLHPHGRLITEAAPCGIADDLDEHSVVRLHDGTSAHGVTFPWARVGPSALRRHAATAGWVGEAAWSVEGRRFVQLRGCHFSARPADI